MREFFFLIVAVTVGSVSGGLTAHWARRLEERRRGLVAARLVHGAFSGAVQVFAEALGNGRAPDERRLAIAAGIWRSQQEKLYGILNHEEWALIERAGALLMHENNGRGQLSKTARVKLEEAHGLLRQATGFLAARTAPTRRFAFSF